MNIFYGLQEKMRKMDEKHSSVRRSTPASPNNENSHPQLSYEERQKQEQRSERKSYILLAAGAFGAIALLFIFIKYYVLIGDYFINSSVFKIIAIIGFIGMALYMLFLFGGLIDGSFAEAKNSGGRSILVLVVFFIQLAVVFTLMKRCT